LPHVQFLEEAEIAVRTELPETPVVGLGFEIEIEKLKEYCRDKHSFSQMASFLSVSKAQVCQSISNYHIPIKISEGFVYKGQLNDLGQMHGTGKLFGEELLIERKNASGIAALDSRASGVGGVQADEYVVSEVYVGEFKEHQMHGHGKLILPGKLMYEGQFEEDNFTGIGTFRGVDGFTYTGAYQDGLRTGQGTLKNAEFEFSGKFLDDKLTTGKLVCAVGTVYEGEFRNFDRHGRGKEKLINGEEVIGTWENGKVVGACKLKKLDDTIVDYDNIRELQRALA
jgi:hypothetical protein